MLIVCKLLQHVSVVAKITTWGSSSVWKNKSTAQL